MTGGNWFAETGDNVCIEYRSDGTVFSGTTDFQRVEMVDTAEFGRMLFLDGVANSSEKDEFIYHEVLVHPPMLASETHEKVCIIGGAEGAVIREVLRHPDVKEVWMVDIDEQLVGLCRKYMPGWSRGGFDDPRVNLVFGDGRAFLEKTDREFDVIIVDLSDPMPGSPAVYLFTREFYQLVHERLAPKGAASFQAESLQPWRVELHARMFNTIGGVFREVRTAPYFLPCFHEPHAIILALKTDFPGDGALAARMEARGIEGGYVSPEFLPGLFHVPGYVARAHERYSQALTDQNPLTVESF